MKINDSWKFKDEVSGLSINILSGKNLDRLQIRNSNDNLVRDFWFDKDGVFDGTGAFYDEEEKDGKK